MPGLPTAWPTGLAEGNVAPDAARPISEICGPASEASLKKTRPPYVFGVLILILLLFTGLALSVSAAKAPWIDEGWISVSSWNLAFQGHTGNPVMEPTGFWLGDNLPGIREINYLNMPLYMLAQAAWFRMFGFSVLSMRTLSILWGGIAILAWFALVESFAGSAVALLAVGLTAIDFTFLTSAADGRMDMMCMALWALGIASYLRLREKSLRRAILIANVFIAASIFTHPNGAIGFLLLLVLVGLHDRKRLSWNYVPLCWPYAAGLAGWLAYIAVRPAYFLAQFGTNSGKQSGKLNLMPWESLYREIMIRHLAYFAGDIPWGMPTPPSALIILAVYWMAGCFLIRRARRDKLQSAGYMVCVTGTLLGVLTFLVGFKSPNYLINIIPAYAGCAAICAVLLWRRKGLSRVLAPALLGVLMYFQTSAVITKINKGDSSDYHATVNFIRTHVQRGALIAASSAFFFDLKEFKQTDDMKVGFGTHIHPDFLVVDRMYQFMWDNSFPYQNVGAWLYIRELLKSNARLIYQHGEYAVYSVR